jgi:hypothetical protein
VSIEDAVTEISAHCEHLIKTHEYDQVSDSCACGLEYPCWPRLTAERLVDDLARLAGMDSPTRVVFGSTRAREQYMNDGASIKDLGTDGWTRSSYCDNSSGNCVEVKRLVGAVAVRDTENPDATLMVIPDDSWGAFVAGVKAGEFDRIS